jgi:1-phosphofructokinase
VSTPSGGARPCIVTLTPNPSIDRTLTLGGPLQRGAVHRLESVTSQAGGKGVNISRACLSAGVDTIAVLPAAPDDPFVHELTATGIPSRLVTTHGAVRVNFTVTEPGGTTTKLNSPGPAATPSALRDLADALLDLAQRADWIVLAGSLPPGAPVDWYADLVAMLRGRTKVAVDTSDAPLQALVDRLDTAAPHVMKPNSEELASFTGADAATLESDPYAVAVAARSLVDRGVEAVLATLGGHGGVLVTEEGAWHAAAPPTTVVSTVGDLLGDLNRADPAQRLALAVAYGSAATALPGTTIPHRPHVHPERVVVQRLPHLIHHH